MKCSLFAKVSLFSKHSPLWPVQLLVAPYSTLISDMAAGMKRKSETWDVSDIQESASATVYGLVTQLSLVKNSKKNPAVLYFNGQISDGKNNARIVSFERSLHKALQEAYQTRSSVSFVNCQIKPNNIDQRLEIVATSQSRVETSPRKYTKLELEAATKQSDLADLTELAVNQSVDITIKVMTVNPITVVKKDGSNINKQDCIITDSTGSCCLKLWDNDVNTLCQEKCYDIKAAGVHIYNNIKFLSAGRLLFFNRA